MMYATYPFINTCRVSTGTTSDPADMRVGKDITAGGQYLMSDITGVPADNSPSYASDVRSLTGGFVTQTVSARNESAKYIDPSMRVCPNASQILSMTNYTRLEPSEGCVPLRTVYNADDMIRGRSVSDFVGGDNSVLAQSSEVGPRANCKYFNQDYVYKRGSEAADYSSLPPMVFSTAGVDRIYNNDLKRLYDKYCYFY